MSSSSAETGAENRGQRQLISKVRKSPQGTLAWDWCLPKERKPLVATIPEGKVHPHRSLQSSPCLLSQEGRESAQRVLGILHFPQAVERSDGVTPSMTRSLSKTGTTSSLTPWDPAKIPKTCNQIYGSQAPEAERKTKFLPKSSSEMSLFADAARKTMTPFDASIRY